MADLATVLQGEVHRFSALIHINTTPPARYWIGPDDLRLPADDTLDPGGTYEGLGTLTGLPAFRQLIGGIAEQVQVTFSGVSTVPRSWVNDTESDIVGSIMTVGLMFFDDNLQPATPALWVWSGTVDVPGITVGKVRTIALTVGSELIDRARAALLMWSNADHQAAHPGDRFFERTSLNDLFQLKWPE